MLDMSIAMIFISTIGAVVLLTIAGILLAIRTLAVAHRQQAKEDAALARSMDKWITTIGEREERRRLRQTERRAARLSKPRHSIVRATPVQADRQRA
ncbi:MAG: hypothetical protein EON58_02630 [Alphaproteobacteria bacterium]|jgi:hypothetical protein|nr:MAG: hypothetical protein EON58_02630 [Alphaproteobacteria bacterium]